MTAAETVLPARRAELIFRPLGEDGQHVVKDPRTGAYFKLGLEESFLFARLDGRQSVEEVCRAFSCRFGEPLDPQDLEGFLGLAGDSGFLATTSSAPLAAEGRLSHADDLHAPQAAPRTARVTEQAQPAVVPTRQPAAATGPEHKQSILYWRKSVFDPDALFNRLEPRLRFLWTRTFVILSAAGIVAATMVSWLNRRELVSDLPLAWAARWEVLLVAWLTLVLATTLHEFAHGLTCKHFGGEVHEVGFLMMFFLPCFYCNVSDAWLFQQKSRRLWVTLAGGWCDLCLWSLAVFVWRLTPPDTLPHYLAWLLMGVAGARIFFNFNPLLKLDGYYLLSDAVEMSNLRPRAWDRFMAHVRWLLWGAPKPTAEPRGRLLLIFGIAAWAYSALFLGLMVVGLTHWWGRSWGTAGAAAALALGFVTSRSAVQGLSNGEVSQMVKSRKGRALAWVGIVAAVGAAACVVPVRDRAAGPFRLRAAKRAEIRAPVAGFLREVFFEEGQPVNADAVVVRMEVPELDSRIAQLESRRAESQAELAVMRAGPQADRAGAGNDAGEAHFWRIKAAAAQVERLAEEQWNLRSQRLKQPVTSPVAGVLTTPRLREKVGQYFREGELICEVEDASLLEAEVAVPEQDMARVRPGQRVELKARVAPFDTLVAEVTRVASTAKDPAPPGGGAVAATAPATSIGEMPGHVVVYCTVSSATAAEALSAVRPGMTGHARIDCGRRPVGRVMGERLMRYVRTEFWW
jgi:multidrug efflux pump subunit AcrA (membrane-fusion protein)